MRLAQSKGEAYERIRQKLRELYLKTDFADPANINKAPSFDEYGINNIANELVNVDWEFYMVRPDFVESLKQLSVPALFLHGTKDPRSIEFAEELANYLPYVTFVSFPETGHYIYIEQPEKIKAALRQFIEKIRI